MHTSWHQLALVAFFPGVFVLAGVAVALNREALWREPRFRVLLALAIVGLLGSYPRPDRVHLSFTVALGCPLVSLVVTHIRGLGRIVVGAVFAGLCLVGLVGAAATAVVVSRLPGVVTLRGAIVPSPNLTSHDFAALVAEIEKVPGDRAFFFYPYSPLLPYLTGRRHAAGVDVMVPGYTTAAQFRATCARVATDAQWTVLDRQLSDPSVLRKSFPAMRDPDPPEKRHFESALRAAFDEIVYVSTRFELRKRSRGAPTVPCERIQAARADWRPESMMEENGKGSRSAMLYK
jgi:hypothetical protein